MAFVNGILGSSHTQPQQPVDHSHVCAIHFPLNTVVNTVFSVEDKVLIKSLYQFGAGWYKLLMKTLSLALKTMFTQRSRHA